ncbi:hypothetical protein [Chitinophaga tropicalis]|uniref:Uncharacterized protein n=1 Tax=Chitinophaga tropicalis TaxID=2683588 RepID=A0A7K1U5M9_9BACT|nr:hypothetical protein [Chitinophaga tropicalis]MVT09668.1 hypothetical protein [Chitinophaga tropicalis]
MKQSATSYKALYYAGLKQQAAQQERLALQETLIVMQQEQLLLLQEERETKDAIMFGQDQLICQLHQSLDSKDE